MNRPTTACGTRGQELMPAAHARLSPSSSKRWMACPGSVALSEGIRDTPSRYSAEGSAAHALLEWALDEQYHDLQDQVGESWEHDGFSGDVTEEMVGAVQVAVDYVRRRIEDSVPDVEVHLERRVGFARLNPPSGLDGGTADVTLWSGGGLRDLEIIDYKHGAGVFVEVQDNPQLLQYALGAVATDGRRPETVTTTIVQPRHHTGDPVRSATYTWAELVDFKKDLFAAAAATEDPGAPLVLGDHCRFCPALPQCPAHQEHAVALAQAEFDELAEDPDILRDPKLLRPGDLGEVLRGASFVEDWIKAVRAYVADLIEKGTDVPGWKLVAGRANRRWGDEEKAEQYLARKGFTIDQRYKRTLVSPAQAEKLLKSAGAKTNFVQRFIEQPEGAPKLVPAGDPRPALASSVEADFAEFMED